ncbi:hypothetical protein XCR_2619 [Xanthomonas campestris pv. raphani 756C]|nr:hypothetical protein XCR_2619 [Xanthomonas campestris pv. raphani 756C]
MVAQRGRPVSWAGRARWHARISGPGEAAQPYNYLNRPVQIA